MGYEIIDAPEGLEHLVLYEIAAKSFTSPEGPESGTFASMEEKIPYLKELGINGIWLSGHQLCDSHHFYNIWTQYACVRPDRLDSSLGTEEEFKHMIDCAHEHGIKVFLDVITHGVMEESDLVKEHPDWFCGGSWGMRDFDWYGGKEELDTWWTDTWVGYVKNFGIDGFRLDVSHYRNDLWALIRRKTAAMGKEIIIIAEMGPAIRGVTDILQHGEVVSHNYGLNCSSRILSDAAGCLMDRQSRMQEHYDVKIYYEDGTVQDSRENTWYKEAKIPEVIWEGIVSEKVECSESAYEIQRGNLRVENIFGEKEIHNIQVLDKQGQVWNSNRQEALEVDYKVEYVHKRNGLRLDFPLRIQDGQFMSVQLSCHDNGWEGFGENENPYGAQGSRYIAGYTTFLAPAVPVFMAGEEFNADYRPLPQLSPHLFGGEPVGKGRWLYGSWIDWEQLNLHEKKDMLDDVKNMLRIRRNHSEMIKACKMGDTVRTFGTLEYESDDELPVPYYYLGEETILAVAANPNTDRDVYLKLNLEELLSSEKSWRTKALFGTLPEGMQEIAESRELVRTKWQIKKDKIRQGGLLVLEFEKV